MATPTVTVTRTSRYKDTVPFLSAGGVEFSLWEPPVEFYAEVTGYQFHQVTAREIGFLDELAAMYYGDGNEALWWVIAQANGMIDPDRDMHVGDVLVIPPRSKLSEFIARAGDAAAD
jgi:hypothetical protein